ncbi:hypothetical protein RCL1_000210 [Eukaryota sp. TZLM3-RCL]
MSFSPQTSCECSQLSWRLSLLEDSISELKDDYAALNGKITDISSATHTHISLLVDRILALEAIVVKQKDEISLLSSERSLISPEQSNLIDQFSVFLPFIKELQSSITFEEVRLNPIAFICKYPSEVYDRFGNRTKFIGETKGSCLELSNDECLVRSTRQGKNNSFVAINHPLNGTITLTLRSTHSDGDQFSSYVGYFNPYNCQFEDSVNHFSGINPTNVGLRIFIGGSCEKVASKLSPFQSIIISFENNKATYSTPHSGWSRTVDCVDGWVFGIFVASFFHFDCHSSQSLDKVELFNQIQKVLARNLSLSYSLFESMLLTVKVASRT